MQPFFDALAEAGKDGKFSENETDQLRQLNEAISERLRESIKEYEKVLKPSESPQESESHNSLQGAIKGMSQESADLMAGQLGGMRIHLADIATTTRNWLSIATSQLKHLERIAISTGVSAEKLTSMENKMNEQTNYLKSIDKKAGSAGATLTGNGL